MEPGSDLTTQKRKRLVKTGALVHNQTDPRVKLPGAGSTRGQTDVRVMQPWATRLEDVHHRKLQTPAGIATRGLPVAESCARTRSGGRKNRRDSGGTRTLCVPLQTLTPCLLGWGQMAWMALARPWRLALDPCSPEPSHHHGRQLQGLPGALHLTRRSRSRWHLRARRRRRSRHHSRCERPDAVLQHPLVVPAGAVSQGLARRASLARQWLDPGHGVPSLGARSGWLGRWTRWVPWHLPAALVVRHRGR